VSQLAKRDFRFPAKTRRMFPALNAFLAPQRHRKPKVQHPKPEKGHA
jgi:hypothetical protein